MDRCEASSGHPGEVLLFWGQMSPTLVAVAVVGLAWAYAAAAAARWPSAHLLAIVGITGLFGGVSTTDRYAPSRRFAALPLRSTDPLRGSAPRIRVLRRFAPRIRGAAPPLTWLCRGAAAGITPEGT